VRQLLTWRFVAALGALVLLAVGANTVLLGDQLQAEIAVVSPQMLGADGEIIERKIDLIETAERIERSEDFAVGDDGLTVGFLDAVLEPNRVMRVAPGTPGEIRCDNLLAPDRCVVFADVLGDAVVWFALLPRGPSDTVELPPIIDLQDGYALFENGWQVPYAPVIERECQDEDITSFSDFLRRFGPGSSTFFDLEASLITAVKCDVSFVAPTTTVVYEGSLNGSIVMPTTSALPGLEPVEAPEN
jgi:hypothetical protein